MSALLTGGCQCGAVRYALSAVPEKPCVCYCRMCQKASGNILATFATVDIEDFALTRGDVTWWSSSDQGERGFCATCGTPLLWRNPFEHRRMSVTLGSLDHPARVKPVISYGGESKIEWVDEAVLRAPVVIGEGVTARWPRELVQATNHQHPDHDTLDWVPFTSNAS